MNLRMRYLPAIVSCAMTAWAAPSAAATAQQHEIRELADAVRKELEHDPLVSTTEIVVTNSNGVITLSGAAPSLLAKQRAGRITETVRGVLSVSNELAVQVPDVAPDVLERAVKQALLKDPATDAYQVAVSVAPEGRVSLSGVAESHAEKALIEDVASSVRGVRSLTNDVTVKYRPNRPDSELASEIRGLLRWDAHIDDAGIDLQVEDGVAMLSGHVSSAAQKRRAGTLAWVSGIRDVETKSLRVADATAQVSDVQKSPPANGAERQIATAIRNALAGNARVGPNDLAVTVRSGVATLRGEVESLQAKREASRTALEVAGVASVRDRMQIARHSASDRQLRERIEAALAANMITDSHQIDVQATQGNVTLQGQVDSWFERGTADSIAASVTGVRGVDNELAVANRQDRLAYDPYVDEWSIHDYEWYEPTPPGHPLSDAAIARDVRDELWWSSEVDRGELIVAVDNGVVTLQGRVDSHAESRAAVENALEGGALVVVNELEIERPERAAMDAN